MKKLIWLILLIPCLAFADVDTFDGQTGIDTWDGQTGIDTVDGQGVASGGASPECSEDFSGGSQPEASVAANSMFESETDASGKLSMTSNKLYFVADTDGTDGYVIESSCVDNESEVTIKFTIEFDDIENIADGVKQTVIITLYDNTPADYVGKAVFQTNASGHLDNYMVFRDGETATSVSMTGVAADTSYDCVFYWLKDASAGGASFKCGAWNASTTGFNDDTSGETGVGYMRFGGADNSFGGGSTDTTIKFDDFEIYHSDQR